MLITLIEIILVAIVLLGIWHEEKLIQIEEKIKDGAAWCIAQVILWHRHKRKQAANNAKY